MSHPDPAHDHIRELLALRLYDELEPTESAELDAHLTACTDCRSFAVELAKGLGALPSAAPIPSAAEASGAADKERTLALQAHAPAPRRRGIAVVAFACGLAAGLLVAVSVGRLSPPPFEAERKHLSEPQPLPVDQRLALTTTVEASTRWQRWSASTSPPPSTPAPIAYSAQALATVDEELHRRYTARTGD